MYTIEKTFTGDLAHRIHTQKLDSDFTEGKCKTLKCRRLHGHTFSLKVKLGSEMLVNNMVLDYNELGFIKEMIADIMDHRTLIADSDPIFHKVLKPLFERSWSSDGTSDIEWLIATPWSTSEDVVFKYNLNGIEDPDIREFFDSFVVVPFTTSSENISRWIYNMVQKRIDAYNKAHSTSVKVISVSYLETPTSEAVYTG